MLSVPYGPREPTSHCYCLCPDQSLAKLFVCFWSISGSWRCLACICTFSHPLYSIHDYDVFDPKRHFLKSELSMPHWFTSPAVFKSFLKRCMSIILQNHPCPKSLSLTLPHECLVGSVWIIISFFHTLQILFHWFLLFLFQMRVLLLIRFVFLSNDLLFDACRISHLILAIHKLCV